MADVRARIARAAPSRGSTTLALIDVALPDMDGYRLRAAPNVRRIGLVAVTGFGQAEDQQRAFEAGFDAHLVKPVSPERVEQVIAGLR
jgi:CheY-like chemotaxis protein